MEFKIPPLPNTLAEVLEYISEDTSTLDTNGLIAIIERDPATSLYVLRQVNSPYYGLRRHISEVDHAVKLLGIRKICNLVLTVTLKNSFAFLDSADAKSVYQQIMQTSLATAAFARDLSGHLQMPFAESTFTAGLLHQVGRLIFLYSDAEQYVPLWYQSSDATCTPPSEEAEEALFSTPYPQIGADTMEKWDFPKELVTITRHVFTPDEVTEGRLRGLTFTVAAAHAAAETLFSSNGPDEESPELAQALDDLAHLRNTDARDLATYLNERSEAVREFAQAALAA